jgi:hypothetical protein
MNLTISRLDNRVRYISWSKYISCVFLPLPLRYSLGLVRFLQFHMDCYVLEWIGMDFNLLWI